MFHFQTKNFDENFVCIHLILIIEFSNFYREISNQNFKIFCVVLCHFLNKCYFDNLYVNLKIKSISKNLDSII